MKYFLGDIVIAFHREKLIVIKEQPYLYELDSKYGIDYKVYRASNKCEILVSDYQFELIARKII